MKRNEIILLVQIDDVGIIVQNGHWKSLKVKI